MFWVLLWSYPVIYISYKFFNVYHPAPFRINYERAVYVESICNGLLCTYFGIVYPNSIIDYIVLSHVLSDCLYLYLLRPFDYYMIVHHLFTINYLLMAICYFSNTINTIALGFAETTNVLFNTKLLLKSFGTKNKKLNLSFNCLFILIRSSVIPVLIGMDFQSLLALNSWTFSTYNYMSSVFILYMIGLYFSFRLVQLEFMKQSRP